MFKVCDGRNTNVRIIYQTIASAEEVMKQVKEGRVHVGITEKVIIQEYRRVEYSRTLKQNQEPLEEIPMFGSYSK